MGKNQCYSLILLNIIIKALLRAIATIMNIILCSIGGLIMGAIWLIEREVKQYQRLINHLLWHTDEIHTTVSLSRFFQSQDDIDSRLARLVKLGILQKTESGAYNLSQNQLVLKVIKRINEKDRAARNLVDYLLSHLV